MTSSAASHRQPSASRLTKIAYTLVLLAYWALLYTTSLSEDVERGSVLYALYLGPVLLFAALFTIPTLFKRAVTLPIALLISYAAIVIAVALARGDFPTVSSTLIMTLLLIVISSERLTPPLALLNWLFLASIPASLITYLAGNNIYGILPGMSLDEALWWRISLFPAVPESAFFSAVVVLANLSCRGLPMRRTCILLASYFLLFAGLRSALIGTLMALAYMVAVRRGWLREPGAIMLWLLGAAVTFVASLLLIDLLTVVPEFNSEFLNTYLFRSKEGLGSVDDLTKSIYRTWLWSEHFRIAATSPWVGIGTNDFALLADTSLKMPVGSGSESFLTGLYARVGLPALLLLGFFVATVKSQVRGGRVLPPAISLLLFVAMLAYGSFLVPYNFAFLVMLGLLCGHAPQTAVCPRIPIRSSVWRLRAKSRGRT